MKTIEIRSIYGRVIWSGEAEDMRAALKAAIADGSNLSGSDLSDSNLSGSNLSGSNLSGSNLRDSNLSGSNLSGSNLSGSDLSDSNLSGSNLSGSNLRDSDLSDSDLSGSNLSGSNLSGSDLSDSDLSGAIGAAQWLATVRADVRAVLNAAPSEVPGLLAALRAGMVDGATYEGECACLVGTLANVRGCHYSELGSVEPDSDRPAERFFLDIRRGDTPTTSKEAALAAAWIQEWIDERGAAKSADEVAT